MSADVRFQADTVADDCRVALVSNESDRRMGHA